MYEFQRFRVFLVKVHACYATVIDLPPEFPEVSAPLVPYPCFGEQSAAFPCFENADGEVDVLAETHLRESSQFHIYVAPDSHIEGAWVELVELLLATPDASGGEERRHGIGDGLLCVGERIVGTVRSAESIGRFAVELVADGLQIAIGSTTSESRMRRYSPSARSAP